jgi:predicted  nucleic acid-binding Zn-ribbon protein
MKDKKISDNLIKINKLENELVSLFKLIQKEKSRNENLRSKLHSEINKKNELAKYHRPHSSNQHSISGKGIFAV